MISVVIPTLNEEKCVRMCLESLKKQDYQGEYEIILVDAYSSDKTAQIAKEYTDRVFLLPPKGPGMARNYGATQAKYPLVAFIDADCIAPSDWLSKIEENFKSTELIGLGGVLRPQEGLMFDKMMFRLTSDWWVRISAWLGIYQLYGNCCAYRKEKFFELKGFNTNVSFWEDTELSMRMKKIGKCHIDGRWYVETSTRRFRQMGYPKVFWVNMKAFISFAMHKPIKTKYFQEIDH
ncbi:MAG: glycosyltransferase [Candidatus Micrarchaeota archaeon]